MKRKRVRKRKRKRSSMSGRRNGLPKIQRLSDLAVRVHPPSDVPLAMSTDSKAELNVTA